MGGRPVGMGLGGMGMAAGWGRRIRLWGAGMPVPCEGRARARARARRREKAKREKSSTHPQPHQCTQHSSASTQMTTLLDTYIYSTCNMLAPDDNVEHAMPRYRCQCHAIPFVMQIYESTIQCTPSYAATPSRPNPTTPLEPRLASIYLREIYVECAYT
jgi:hypothetical protein